MSSQDFSSLRVAAPFPRERKNGESFSFVGGKGAATLRLGFQVILRICLVFRVKISSHQSPFLPFPPWKTIEPEPPRGALWPGNARNFANKIATKERDDGMVKFR